MAENAQIKSPFLRKGPNTCQMMLGMLGCLVLTAAHFSWRYDPAFFVRFLLLVGAGWIIELVYQLLLHGRLTVPRPSTGVTVALLVLSVPAHMPMHHILCGIGVAVLFGKLLVAKDALRVNPMILGRLFLMFFFAQSIQEWLPPNVEIDAFTSATPLGLYKAETVTYDTVNIFTGTIRGDWEGIYAILPGAPGEVMPLLALLFGVVLYWTGIIDWRPGAGFVGAFALTCALLGMPVLFHVLAGSVVFSAVYILSDPRSMPGSKFGRLLAGVIAGVVNALVRHVGYYPEGIVFAVLAANVASPTLDRIAFAVRGLQLRQRAQSALKRQP